MAKKATKTVRAYRDSHTGQFIPQDEARKNPATTVVERIPRPGEVSRKSKDAIDRIDRKYDKVLDRLAKR